MSALVVTLALAGCSNPNDPSSDLLRASASNRTLEVENTSSDRVYYFAVDKNTLALLDWAACIEPANPNCKSLDGGQTERISYSDIFGTDEDGGGSTAVIYHWRLIPVGAGKYKIDSIRNLEVELR